MVIFGYILHDMNFMYIISLLTVLYIFGILNKLQHTQTRIVTAIVKNPILDNKVCLMSIIQYSKCYSSIEKGYSIRNAVNQANQ